VTARYSEMRERSGKVLFIKLLRVLAAVFITGLICHLLFSTGKKSGSTGRGRKFVRSSVIEKKGETSESDKDKS